jgi:hypothetical protein
MVSMLRAFSLPVVIESIDPACAETAEESRTRTMMLRRMTQYSGKLIRREYEKSLKID